MPVAPRVQPNPEAVRPAPEVAPKTPEVAPLPVEGVLDYNQIVTEWAKKNEFHRQTEALATFLAEGGQELIAAYGAQKVADELLVFLEKPVDEKTGLYMLIRALEPNVKKREKLYAHMEQSVDQAVGDYEEGYKALKTKEERAEFLRAHGGAYAPTKGNGNTRRAHINDYRTFDRNAFSIVGGITETLRPSVPHAKTAVKELQGHFDRKLFVRMVDGHGSLEKYVAARLVNEEETERYLEAHKTERLKELDREFRTQHSETEAMYKEKFAEIEEEERVLFGEHPFLASNAPDVGEWRDVVMSGLFYKIVDITEEMKDAVRDAFPSIYAVIDTITTPKKKEAALEKFYEEQSEKIEEIRAPFLLRIQTLKRYKQSIETPRAVPDSDAVKAARAVLKEKKAAVEREVQTRTNVFAVRIIAEIKRLKALNVKQDK
ncbi:MAG: hypothetical protein AAB663_03005 [Patescibacteria group bacterium]